MRRHHIERFQADLAAGKTARDLKIGPRARSIVRGGKGVASRSVGMLGAIFTFAVGRGYCAENPVRGVKRFPDGKSERFLSSTEMIRLGEALDLSDRECLEDPSALNAIRLIALSGCRKNEALSLEWSFVDFDHGCLHLPDSKTGQKVIILGAAALELLSQLPRLEGNEFVFPGHKPGKHFVGLTRVWERLRKRADIEDVRIHDLRHSFGATGASAGMGLPIVGKLLGHRHAATTSRYGHVAPDPARAAADRIAGTISAALNGKSYEEYNIVDLSKRNA